MSAPFSGSALLQIRGLHTFYGKIEALKGIDLDIAEGEIATAEPKRQSVASGGGSRQIGAASSRSAS